MGNSTTEFERTFVPENTNAGNWEDIEPLLNQLLDREINSVKELESWILDNSELAACISEERSRRYIAMTCHTDDEDIEKKYLEFIETIVPRSKPYWFKLDEKYMKCPFRQELPQERYEVLDRGIEAEVKIYREENIPLQTEESKLSQQYQKICGAMMVEFDGKEQTMPQMAKYLEETDRERRKEAWVKTANRRLQEREQFDEIFDKLIHIRNSIARNAGFEDFRKYAFLMFKRFDYTPVHCLDFHEAVEKCVVPLARSLNNKRRKEMNIEHLCPWDLSVDPKGRPPLRPFETVDELTSGVEKIFQKLDPDLASRFNEMNERGELDLDSRKGKAPGGYLSSLDEIRRPFIFMNAAGLQRDVETLLHESGHAFHMLESRGEPLLAYRDAPLEFAEVASMTMELFGSDYLTEFYSQEDADRAKRNMLEGIISILPWIARIDAFQHWLYSHPNHSQEDRTMHWLELDDRFGPIIHWDEHKATRESLWQRQLHLFCYPFYYIEYGIAQLGALQLWQQFKNDPDNALRLYRSALAFGGSRPLPQLFDAAGATFDFSEETIQPLVATLEEELDKLPV